MKKIKFMIWLVIAFCFNRTVFAANQNIGTSAAAFLKIPAGARASSMGGAFSAVVGDPSGIFYNPASVASIARPSFNAQYGAHFQGIGFNAVAFEMPFNNAGNIGLGIINLSTLNMDKRLLDTETPISQFDANDSAYMVNYSRQVSYTLSAGINLKFINQRIDTAGASTVAGDAGILWLTPVEHLKAGFAVQNLGSGLKFIDQEDPLPTIYRAGAAYSFAAGRQNNLMFLLDVNLPRDNDASIIFGTEYARTLSGDMSAAVRGGYMAGPDAKPGELFGLSAGMGFTWRQFTFDFAWVPYGELGNTFRYSLGVKF